MKIFVLVLWLVTGILVYIGLNRSSDFGNAAIAEQKRPDLSAIFNNGNYRQYIDQSGTVVRAAFDPSGKRIGVQIGTYRPDVPNGMSLEMTYLEPDAEHPLGQAFDGAANPLPLHTGPRA